MRSGIWPRGDVDHASAILDRVATPGGEKGLDDAFGLRAASRPIAIERVVFLRSVALPQYEAETSAAGKVEDRDVLGEPDRVVQRPEQRAGAHLDAGRPGDDKRRHNERRWQPADRGIVMLLDVDDREPALIGIGRHVERSAVTLRLRPAVDGVPAHV